MLSERENITRSELIWAFWLSAAVMAVTCLPVVIGIVSSPEDAEFLGFPFNVADSMVYMSWMRQAADGHFFIKNLFTSEPQKGIGFNLLFFVLGTFARVFHLSLIVVYQLARILFGTLFFVATYRLFALFAKNSTERRLGLLLTCSSAGIGWFFVLALRMTLPEIGSLDVWQPEAITFASVYWSPLFSFALLLMIVVLYLLVMFVRQGTWKHAFAAGVALGVLANVHTYDAMTIGIAWFLFCLYSLARKRFNCRPLIGGLIATMIAVPFLGYQVYFYLSEPVFRARVATATVSPHFAWVLAGFGLLFPLAMLGVVRAISHRMDPSLLVCWVIAGLVGAYLPLPFQRKLIMGTHVPLSFLAAMGVCFLTARLNARSRTIVTLAIVLLLVPTNLLRLIWDIRNIRMNLDTATGLAYYVSDAQLHAIACLRQHTCERDIVLAPPQMSTLIPGIAGRRVFCGHWGECPNAERKTYEAFAFFSSETPDNLRREFLAKENITLVVEDHSGIYGNMPLEDFRSDPPDFLIPVFQQDDVAVYKVKL